MAELGDGKPTSDQAVPDHLVEFISKLCHCIILADWPAMITGRVSMKPSFRPGHQNPDEIEA